MHSLQIVSVMMGLLGFFGKKDLTYRTFEKWVDTSLSADMPEGDEPKFSAVICTVPSTQADLSTTLKAAKIHGYTGRIEKDAETYASEGLVTYTATWVKEGFTIIFR